jgi:hypothetical protein
LPRQYEGGEPCKICGHVLTAAAAGRPETVMPTTVVPGFLYLGSYDTASRQELLKAMQITDILNVSGGRGRRARREILRSAHVPGKQRLQAVGRGGRGSTEGRRWRRQQRASVANGVDPRPPTPSPQTVPSCQPLFKNTFNYHTVSVAPPEFEECFEFLGGLRLEGCLGRAADSRYACSCDVAVKEPAPHGRLGRPPR